MDICLNAYLGELFNPKTGLPILLYNLNNQYFMHGHYKNDTYKDALICVDKFAYYYKFHRPLFQKLSDL